MGGSKSWILFGCLATLFLSVASQDAPSCNATVLYQCQNLFQSTTGIDLRLNYREVRRQLEDHYSAINSTTFRSVCKGFRQFGLCMREKFFPCFSLSYLIQNDSLTVQDAYHILQLYYQAHFVCGAGFGTFINIEDCLSSTWRDQRSPLDAARDWFDTQLPHGQTNWPQSYVCIIGDTLKHNYSLTFQNGCTGSPIDASWWGCEYARIYVMSQFPYCSDAAFRCVRPPLVSP